MKRTRAAVDDQQPFDSLATEPEFDGIKLVGTMSANSSVDWQVECDGAQRVIVGDTIDEILEQVDLPKEMQEQMRAAAALRMRGVKVTEGFLIDAICRWTSCKEEGLTHVAAMWEDAIYHRTKRAELPTFDLLPSCTRVSNQLVVELGFRRRMHPGYVAWVLAGIHLRQLEEMWDNAARRGPARNIFR